METLIPKRGLTSVSDTTNRTRTVISHRYISNYLLQYSLPLHKLLVLSLRGFQLGTKLLSGYYNSCTTQSGQRYAPGSCLAGITSHLDLAHSYWSSEEPKAPPFCESTLMSDAVNVPSRLRRGLMSVVQPRSV